MITQTRAPGWEPKCISDICHHKWSDWSLAVTGSWSTLSPDDRVNNSSSCHCKLLSRPFKLRWTTDGGKMSRFCHKDSHAKSSKGIYSIDVTWYSMVSWKFNIKKCRSKPLSHTRDFMIWYTYHEIVWYIIASLRFNVKSALGHADMSLEVTQGILYCGCRMADHGRLCFTIAIRCHL